jgi:type IV pilus assembly protein PilO
MTLSDDLNFGEQGGFDEATPASPVLFGIAFTPKIIGIIVGVIGLAGAGYILLNLLMPALESYQPKALNCKGKLSKKKPVSKKLAKLKTS